MRITKLKIESDAFGFGCAPAFNAELEQHVVIHSNGRVKISCYVDGFHMPKALRLTKKCRLFHIYICRSYISIMGHLITAEIDCLNIPA